MMEREMGGPSVPTDDLKFGFTISSPAITFPDIF